MFKKIREDAILPTRGSKYSACVDVYANEDVVIGAGGTKVIGLGICIDLDKLSKQLYEVSYSYLLQSRNEVLINEFDNFLNSHYLQLMLRSSLGKKGLILPNGVGVIDLDYKDEIKMIIHNPTQEQQLYADASGAICGSSTNPPCKITKGDRIGQITLLGHKSYLFGIESEDERDGGFGSTGVN